MAVVTQPVITRPRSAQDETSSREQRGITTIPAKVVARVATQAAREIGNASSNAGGLLGIDARRNFAPRPGAQCELYGRVTALHLDLGLVFPMSLSSIIDDLHTHVRGRVEYLTRPSTGKITIEAS